MTRLKATGLLLIVTVSITTATLGQSSVTGTPPFASFQSGPFGTLNLGNLNVHLVIPVVSKAGRGTPFNFSLSYDSTVWTPVTSGSVTSWQSAGNWGWTTLTAAAFGSVTTASYTATCNNPDTGQRYQVPATKITSYTDPTNTAHQLHIPEDPCQLGSTLQGTVTDGSGWTVYYLNGLIWATSRSGQTFYVGSSYADTNGNEISASGNSMIDTLGQTALTTSGTNPVLYTWTNPQSTTSSVKVYYSTFQIKSGFGCSSVNDVTMANQQLITSIVMPDNTSYVFTYEPTNNAPGYYTGRMKTITLPTGGQISYSYSGGSAGIECADGTAAGLNIVTPDSSTGWTYSRRSTGTGPIWQTTVTDPLGNDTVLKFLDIYETDRYAYQGPQSANVILRTTNT